MKTIVLLALVVLVGWSTMLSSLAATNRWVGGSDARWSNPNNWVPPGVPEQNADLYFYNPGGVVSNDLPNLTVSSLNFLGIGENWQLRGNPLNLGGSIRNFYGSVDIQCDLRLAADSYFSWNGFKITGAIDLNGHNLNVRVAGDDTIDLSGAVVGDGELTLEADGLNGMVKFSGSAANTFPREVTCVDYVNVLLDKQSGPAIPGALDIGPFSTVKLNRPHQIGDAATVVLRHGARLELQGNAETISGLFMFGSPPSPLPFMTEVNTGGATLSLTDNITAMNHSTNTVPVIVGKLALPAGNHVIHTGGSQPWSLNIEAQIVGGGGITKSGDKGLVLNASNSFSGDLIVQEGRVDVGHTNALGSSNGVTILEGGQLDVRGVIANETLIASQLSPNTAGNGANLNVDGVATWGGPVILDTNLVVNGGSMTFSGSISGPAGLYILNAGTHLEGNAPNTYQGLTYVRGPLLELNKPSGVRAISGKLEVHSAGINVGEVRWQQDYQSVGVDVTLFENGLINLYGHWDDFGPITFNGGTIATGSGELGLYGLVKVNFSSAEAVFSGRIGLPPGAHEFRVSDGLPLADLTVNAAIGGSGGLRKTGLGQMWLNASNSYAGTTLVEEGSLVAFNANALGASSLGTSVSLGASLILYAPDSVVWEQVAVAGSGDGSHGTLNIFNSVTLRNPSPAFGPCLDLSSNAVIRVEANSVFTVDGVVSGSGPLTKSGPGTLVLANASPNNYSGDTLVTEGVLNLAKPSLAIAVPGNLIVGPAPLSSTAIARWSASGGMNPGAIATINARSLLDLNGNSLSLARLNLNDGGDAQTGAGRLNFGLGGMIAVGSLSQFGSHAGSTISGSLGLPANATLTFAVNGYAPTAPFDFNPELDMSANIPAPAESPNFERAGIAKTGVGTLRLSGTSSFNGRVDATGGTLIAASSLALGSSFDGTVVMNNARLALENSLNVESEVLVLNSSSAPALENLSGDSYWSGSVIMNQNSTVGVRPSSALQLAGIISGAANFIKVGLGTLRFGGVNNNTYSGQTFINEGTLLLGKPFVVTAVPGVLNIGTPAGVPATVANLTSYQVVGNIIVNRGGSLNVGDQVENVDHLWLYEGGDVHTTTGTLFLKAGGSIQVFPGAVHEASTIAGNLDMDGGPHFLNVDSITGPTVGPALDITALITSSLGLISLQKVGTGILRLAANNTYSGSAVINAGTLQVDGSQPSSSVVVGENARLTGHGRVGPVTFAHPTGVVAPGTSPGTLQVGHFNLDDAGGLLQMELNGPTLGADYDRLTVRGFMSLNGITLQAVVNFHPALGAQFVIIGNDLLDPVDGTFNNLPQGATVTFGDHVFQINYAGGDGNDVVLTKIADVFRPVLTIQRFGINSVRLLWPTNDPSFVLQSATNLTGTPVGWSPVPESPTVSGTNYVITHSLAGTQRLYRLIKP